MRSYSQVRDVSGGGGVMKTIVKKGKGDFPMDCPIEDCHVKVHWRCVLVSRADAASGANGLV